MTSSVVQVYSDQTLSFGYVIEGLFRDSRNNSTADQCNNGRGNGDGVWLDGAIPGEVEIVIGKNKKKDTILVDNAFSIADANLGISNDQPEREECFCGRRFKRGDDDGDIAPLLKPPLWYAAKYGGFVESNDNDLPDEQAEWDSDEDGDPDGYHMLYAPQNIVDSFSSILDLIAGVSSSSSVVANTQQLQDGTMIYQGRFDSSNWSGDVVAFPVLDGGSLGEGLWSAQERVDQQFDGTGWTNNRIILTATAKTDGGTAFRWDNLSESQQAALNRNPETTNDDGQGEDRLNFIRGDRSEELQQGGLFRDRVHLLGDIVNSDPIYVGRPPFGYSDSLIEGVPYSDFADDPRGASQGERDAMIYLGGNDGMLHAFDARTAAEASSHAGKERFAYVPRAVYSTLPLLPALDYQRNHRFFVDGNQIVGDVVFGYSRWFRQVWEDNWRSVLVGTLGAGGKGVYALDVTDPATFTESADGAVSPLQRVLWDITSEDSEFEDLGYTFSAPTIVLAPLYKLFDEWDLGLFWMSIFGNGYDSTDGKAVLYMLRINDGSVLKSITADVGPGNGLSSVAPVDLDDDKQIDFVYAGDLKGNLWRFDGPSNGLGWRIGHGGLPIFTARDANGNVQPITIRPAVFKRRNGTVLVVFGTGKFFETSDAGADSSVTHSLYGVLDRFDDTSTISRDYLLEQEFLTGATHLGFELRESSDYPMTWHQTAGSLPTGSEEAPAYLGWYLDLIDPTQATGSQSVGELVAAEMRVRGDRVIFTSMIPSEEPCDFGGEGWLIELSYLTGQRPSDVLFDLDGDGRFTVADQPVVSDGGEEETRMTPNAKKSKIGIVQQPAIIGNGGREYKYASGGMPAAVEVTTENPGSASAGRASWLELE